jgi:EAL domain-containing protein (putative c-di-GMP-specific phosphodiesterase class I)
LPAEVFRVAAARLEPSRLKLEIGEGQLHATLKELRKIGVGITLDDFGKASASLGNLRSYSFDDVKIDRALIKDLLLADCAAIVRAVIALSETLGFNTIAEGVETRDELDMVVRAGCNKVQGYYFSRPVPAAELAAALSQCPRKVAFAA